MKVLLVVPVRDKSEDFWVMPPIGLGYLASNVRSEHEVEILNCPKEGFTQNDLKEHVRKAAPQVVGFTMFSHDFRSVQEAVRNVKDVNQEIITVVGGPHPSCVPEDTMSMLKEVDYAIHGEGEEAFPLLLRHVEKKSELEKIPNLAWRNNSGIRVNQRVILGDLDKAGLPAWDLIDLKTYPKTPPTLYFERAPFAPIAATRGCPFPCTFCAGKLVSGKKIRYRSLPHLLKEIELLYHEYGIREIYFVDDNFTSDREYVLSFCEEIGRRKFVLSFANPNGVRLDTLTKDMLLAMKNAGWYYLSVGIEAGTEKVLRHMRKGLTLERVKEKIKLIRECGLEIYGFFILGYPVENLEDIKSTIDLSLKLDLIGASFSNFHPLPGSEIFESLKAAGKINEDNYIQAISGTYADASFAPDGVDVATLKKLQRQAVLKFYLRPRILFKNMKKWKSMEHLRFLLTRAWAYLK